MSKFVAAVAAVALVVAVAPPAHAEDLDGTILNQPRAGVLEFAKKYPAIAGPVDPPIIIVPPDNVAPKDSEAQGAGADPAIGVATGAVGAIEGGAFLAPSRQGGSASSVEQDTRRELKRLIRRLG